MASILWLPEMFLFVAFEDFTAACKHKLYLNRITLWTFDICCVWKCNSVKQNFGKRRTRLFSLLHMMILFATNSSCAVTSLFKMSQHVTTWQSDIEWQRNWVTLPSSLPYTLWYHTLWLVRVGPQHSEHKAHTSDCDILCVFSIYWNKVMFLEKS